MLKSLDGKLSPNIQAVADLIVCPSCYQDLEQCNGRLMCSACKKEFRIEQDIPILITGVASE
jgi:uncharacterized protein YbaR (Trm112 family)